MREFFFFERVNVFFRNLERIARFDRLQVLRAIEKAKEAGERDEDFRRSIRKIVEQYLPLRTVEDMRKDNGVSFRVTPGVLQKTGRS